MDDNENQGVKTKRPPVKCDGVDYSPEGIEALREELIAMRGRAFGNWPEGIEDTVVLSHAIALLAYLKEVV